MTILDKPCCENVVLDFLSRITSDKVNEPLEYSSLDEHVFVV